jgi:hypothetical protein
MSVPVDLLSVSGASLLAGGLFRQLWAYFRKNGFQGKISVEWKVGAASKGRSRSRGELPGGSRP